MWPSGCLQVEVVGPVASSGSLMCPEYRRGCWGAEVVVYEG